MSYVQLSHLTGTCWITCPLRRVLLSLCGYFTPVIGLGYGAQEMKLELDETFVSAPARMRVPSGTPHVALYMLCNRLMIHGHLLLVLCTVSDHTSSERKVEVVPLSWPDSVVVTPTSLRKHRPDSPRPPSSTRSLSVPSVDGDSSSSRGGWGRSFGGEEEARVAPGDYSCQVCLEDKPGKAGFVLSSCGHVFCRACLKGYVVTKVNDGQVYPTCFHDVEDGGETDAANGGLDRRGTKSCGVGIRQKDIEVLLALDHTMHRKYSRFLFCREHATARECPRCNKLQVGNPMESVMKCIDCGAEYCYYHGGAHEGRTCAEYIESTAEETDRTLALIRRLTKPCPGCQTPVEKLGGCNQMICYHCSTSFCWICGQEVDRGTFPVHFQWWNVRGCPNQQLQEEVSPSRASRRCHKFLSILQIVIVGPPALLLTVVSSLACICCLPAFNIPPRQLFMGCFSGWGNFVMVLPILPFILAGAIVLGLIYIILLPFRLVCAVGRKYRLKKMEAASLGGVTSGNMEGIGETGRLRALESGYSSTSVENGETGGRTEGPLVGPRPVLSLSSSSSSSPSFPTSLASPLAEMIRGGDRRNRQEQHSLELRRNQLEHQLQLHLQMNQHRRPSQISPSLWVASRLRQNLATHSDMATISPSPQSPQALASNRPSLLPPADSERSWDMGNVDIEVGLATASSREGLGSSSGAALTMIGPNIEMPGTMGTSLGVRNMVGLWLGASPFASSAGAGAFSSSRPTSMVTTVDRVGGGKGEASDTCE